MPFALVFLLPPARVRSYQPVHGRVAMTMRGVPRALILCLHLLLTLTGFHLLAACIVALLRVHRSHARIVISQLSAILWPSGLLVEILLYIHLKILLRVVTCAPVTFLARLFSRFPHPAAFSPARARSLLHLVQAVSLPFLSFLPAGLLCR